MNKINFITIVFLVLISFLVGIVIIEESGFEVDQDNFALKQNSKQEEEDNNLKLPIKDASKRVTKKPFGIFVAPNNSPVKNERFKGYHTGVDFEVFDNEYDKETSVKAICSGELIQKNYVSGYGGLAVQLCEIKSQKVTVVYGHLDLKSINLELGKNLQAGEKIGVLGDDKSRETDGERKHLHLGIHKGQDINVRGYVDSENKLSEWLDPCDYVCD